MTILLGLAPFLTFFVLMRLVTPVGGLLGGLAVSTLLCLRMWYRSESVKILEICSLVLFGLLSRYTVLAVPEWTVATVRPFTLQCAREHAEVGINVTPGCRIHGASHIGTLRRDVTA